MKVWICDHWNSVYDKKPGLHGQYKIDMWQKDHHCQDSYYLIIHDSSPIWLIKEETSSWFQFHKKIGSLDTMDLFT